MSVASVIARGNGFYKSISGEGDARRERIEAMAKGRYLGLALQTLHRLRSLRRHLHGAARGRRIAPSAVERHWRDARLTKIFEGTSEIQQRIIADTLLGKPSVRGSN